MRILITGSRDWNNGRTILAAVRLHLLDHGLDPLEARDVTIVHGACPTGADQLAGQVADLWHWKQEPYEANWKAHGKAAGPIRNTAMVQAGADVCLTFALPGSKGTLDCAKKARAAGIRVLDYGVLTEAS